MKRHARWAETTTFFVIVLLLILNFTVSTGNVFNVEAMTLKVYKDGVVHVTQSLVVDEFSPKIALTLISSSVENLVILDENHTVVDYQLNNGTLTVFTLGATRVFVEYDTVALTKKDAEVWTLEFDSPYSLIVFLPQNSTVVYLNNVPNAINTTGKELSLSLSPGHWEISYVVPLQPGERGEVRPQTAIPVEYLLVITLLVSTIIIALVFMRKRRINVKKILRRNPNLRKEEIAVIEFIAKNGGKAFEAEIRKHFPDMPRTSLWRLVRRLEKLEIVEVKRIGLENQVQLKK
ncbi:MAG: helix-turn-helix transcriptional regulator [Candidatus Bathyarchaeales archaeon]